MLSAFDVEQIVKRLLGTVQAPIAALKDGTAQSDGHRVLNFQGPGVTVSDDPSNRRTNVFIPGAPAAATSSVFVSTAGSEKVFPVGSIPANWETTGFSDAGWGSSVLESASNAGFYVVAPGGAVWVTETTKNGDIGLGGNEFLLRRTFALPAGTIASATLDLNLDDVSRGLYVNGNALTMPTRTGSPVGYATMSIPIGWLTAGANNVLAIDTYSGGGELAVTYRITVTFTSAGTDAQYELVAHKGAASGYAPLNASSLVPTANLGTGAASGSVFLRGDETWASASTTALNIKEVDGTPNVSATIMRMPNGSLTDDGGGQVTLTFPTTTAAPYINVQDQKTSGTGGGTSSVTWATRTLNTIADDASSLASLASNQVTLPAGTYRYCISAPGNNTGLHQIRLQNITDSTTVRVGTSEFSNDTVQSTRSFVTGRFTIASSKAFAVQHIAGFASTDGWGKAGSFGTEVYTVAEFFKES